MSKYGRNQRKFDAINYNFVIRVFNFYHLVSESISPKSMTSLAETLVVSLPLGQIHSVLIETEVPLHTDGSSMQNTSICSFALCSTEVSARIRFNNRHIFKIPEVNHAIKQFINRFY